MNEASQERYAIVADIGGTNARFCRVDLQLLAIDLLEVYPCQNFAHFEEAFCHYRRTQALDALKQAVVAIACPVMGDKIRMTNLPWHFSIKALKGALNLNHLEVINDFCAIAMSLPLLQPEQRMAIGEGVPRPSCPRVVLGAGTGLGVAFLLKHRHGYAPISSEGGHVSWAPQTKLEHELHRYLSGCFGHVSVERLLSGPGLENLYLALASVEGICVPPTTAVEISHLALNDSNGLGARAVRQFFKSMADFAGDLALTMNSLGGVYLAGGIVPKLLPLLDQGVFRREFENKGRFTAFNRAIPTLAVTMEYPALLGAAAFIRQTKLGAFYAEDCFIT